MYELTQKESFFISTKFSDEARAKLVIRWYELELLKQKNESNLLSQTLGNYPENTLITVAMGNISNQIYIDKGVRLAKMSPIFKYLGYSSSPNHYLPRLQNGVAIKLKFGKQYFWLIERT